MESRLSELRRLMSYSNWIEVRNNGVVIWFNKHEGPIAVGQLPRSHLFDVANSLLTHLCGLDPALQSVAAEETDRWQTRKEKADASPSD